MRHVFIKIGYVFIKIVLVFHRYRCCVLFSSISYFVVVVVVVVVGVGGGIPCFLRL